MGRSKRSEGVEISLIKQLAFNLITNDASDSFAEDAGGGEIAEFFAFHNLFGMADGREDHDIFEKGLCDALNVEVFMWSDAANGVGLCR